MSDTSAKFFHSDMAGLAAMPVAAGSLLTVLRAVLVNGFNAGTVDSISVSAGVATMMISAGMTYEADSVVLLGGCANAALNGEKRLITTGTYAATFDATGVPNGTYTGSPISIKVAPAGWAELFSGTNIAVFQSLNPKSTKCCLRVDDTSPTVALVVGYETMADANTGAGQTPLESQFAGGGKWHKVAEANTQARKWVVFADSRTVYLAIQTSATYVSFITWGFGDLRSAVPGDSFAWFISYCAYGAGTAGWGSSSLIEANGVGRFAPRNGVGAGTSTALTFRVPYDNTSPTSQSFGQGNALFVYPSEKGNGISAAPVIAANTSVLGELPGLLAPVCKCGSVGMLARKRIGGRQYIALPIMSRNGGDAVGSLFFDATGPWND